MNKKQKKAQNNRYGEVWKILVKNGVGVEDRMRIEEFIKDLLKQTIDDAYDEGYRSACAVDRGWLYKKYNVDS